MRCCFCCCFFFFQPKSTDSFLVSPHKQGGWSGVAKVSCILCHLGVQLILVYSSARLVILVAGRDRGQCFYFFYFFSFILVPLSSLTLSFITISSVSFLPFSGRRHKITHKGWRVIKPKHNQILVNICYGYSLEVPHQGASNEMKHF